MHSRERLAWRLPVQGTGLPLADSRSASEDPYIMELAMLHYAVVFLIVALIAALFGFTGIAAGAAGIAKILFVVFLIFAVISFVAMLLRR